MYHFIINPKSSSGRGIQYWWTVKSELDKQQIRYTAVFTKHTGHATELTRTICSENNGIKNIVILGGDGTFNEVINGIDNFNEVLFGYIPSGSSNDLARSLKIPKDPIKALSNILKPTKFKYLDYGLITFFDENMQPRKFACSSGIGYDANVCFEVQSSPLKKRLNRFGAGKFVYIAIAIKQLITVKPSNVTVIVDGGKKDTYDKVLLVSSMIHKYEGGGLLMAPHANPSDGKLSVCLVHGLSPLMAFLLLPTIFTGKHVNYKAVEAFHCSEIEIITDKDTSVHTDGEVPSVCSHIKVSCIREQIRMIL
ncbi:MAG: diacylglycerol kinase family lipid kinase [Herbinix sp.]|nr:diacylglycerol kinase family lipid kinase [Herbinix sp.]